MFLHPLFDRPALYRFFVSLKHPSGGFRMHDDGEVDARGTYTVIAVASLLNMLTPQLSEGVADFAVRSCVMILFLYIYISLFSFSISPLYKSRFFVFLM